MMIEWWHLGALLVIAVLFFFRSQKWKMKALLYKERYTFSEKANQELKESFSSLSKEALDQNNEAFLHLAETSLSKFHEQAKGELEKKEKGIESILSPVKEGLGKLGQGLQQLELERKKDQESLRTQVEGLMEAKGKLRKETAQLVQALRRPSVRGRWGEVQLRRVVELAGMVNRCDFSEQKSSEEGGRPDLIVHLPGKREVIIDAKVPLDSYLDAVELEEGEEKREKFAQHAARLRTHISSLAKKGYHTQFTSALEFVILFLPSENFFSVALEQDPALIEWGAEEGVIIATPTTLIALLRTIAHGWKQEALSEHVKEVSELGRDLYKRILHMTGHFERMGKNLSSAIDAYNKGIGSLESRVLVSARKFKEMGAASSKLDVPFLHPIEKVARSAQQKE